MSNIRDTDLLLVNRSGVSYKCTKSNIGNVRDSDTFLVNRGNVSYYCSKANISNIRDSDTVLVNRSNVSYRATGADLKGIFGPSSPGTSGQTRNWCADIVSSTAGVTNCDRIFEPLSVQNFSRYGSVGPTQYIQFELPHTQPWTYGGNSRVSIDFCTNTRVNIYASTNVTGRGNFEFAFQQVVNTPGRVGLVAALHPLSGATEVYEVRYESANVSQGLNVNNFSYSEQANWRLGTPGSNSHPFADQQVKSTDKYIYVDINGMDANTISPGATLSVAGTSATGKVYKVISSSRVLMSLNSTDPWPAGQITVS